MAAGPTQKQVNAAIRQAKKEAEAFEREFNCYCLPYLQRASNGEACIMYAIRGGALFQSCDSVYTSLDEARRVARDRSLS